MDLGLRPWRSLTTTTAAKRIVFTASRKWNAESDLRNSHNQPRARDQQNTADGRREVRSKQNTGRRAGGGPFSQLGSGRPQAFSPCSLPFLPPEGNFSSGDAMCTVMSEPVIAKPRVQWNSP
jgi:hypothetical protein